MDLLTPPGQDEHAPQAVAYMAHVREEPDILVFLARGVGRVNDVAAFVAEDRWHHPPSPGAWTPADVIQHLIDDERVYAYRTLRFARGDCTTLPGFDQDAYARQADTSRRPLPELAEEFAVVRRSTVALFRSLPSGVEHRRGLADGSPMSVRAAAFHIAGHEVDHLATIRRDHARTPHRRGGSAPCAP